MIDSNQVNALMMQQAQYSAMLQGGPRGMGYSPAYGSSAYPAQFNWAAPSQPGMANRAVAGLGGAVASIPTVLGGVSSMAALTATGMGLAGMQVPAALGAAGMLSPMGAAWGVGSAASAAAGGGLAGMAVAAGPAALAGLGMYGGYRAMSYGVGQTVEGMRQQQALQAQLGGAQFMNSGSYSGRGFSPTGLQQVGNMLRSLDRADPFTTFKDMQQTMQQFSDMGMAQGLQSAEEFANKFKKMAKTVREMARTMGTTMEEATRTFGEMKHAGFYSAKDIAGNTAQMRLAGSLGMGQETFLGMQNQGAAMARSMEMRGRTGATLLSGLSTSLGLDVAAKRLSAETLMDMTGAGTLEAAQADMASRIGGRTMSVFGSSGLGTGVLAALGTKDSSGNYTGGIDQKMLGDFLSGKLSAKDISRLGGQRMGGSKESKASFVAGKEKILSSLLESGEGMDATALLGSLAMGQSGGDEDLAKLYLEAFGVKDRREAELILEMSNKRGARRREAARKLRQSKMADATGARMRESHTMGGLATQVFGGIGDVASAGLTSAGSTMATSLSVETQGWADLVTGSASFQMSDADQQAQIDLLSRGGRKYNMNDSMTGGQAAGRALGILATGGLAGVLDRRNSAGMAGMFSGTGSAREQVAWAKMASGGTVTADDLAGGADPERQRLTGKLSAAWAQEYYGKALEYENTGGLAGAASRIGDAFGKGEWGGGGVRAAWAQSLVEGVRTGAAAGVGLLSRTAALRGTRDSRLAAELAAGGSSAEYARRSLGSAGGSMLRDLAGLKASAETSFGRSVSGGAAASWASGAGAGALLGRIAGAGVSGAEIKAIMDSSNGDMEKAKDALKKKGVTASTEELMELYNETQGVFGSSDASTFEELIQTGGALAAGAALNRARSGMQEMDSALIAAMGEGVFSKLTGNSEATMREGAKELLELAGTKGFASSAAAKTGQGQELMRLSGEVAKAKKAGSVKGAAEALGMDVEDFKKRTGLGEGASASEVQAAVDTLSISETLGLASSGGAAVTSEGRMLKELNTLAENVKKTTEATDKLVTNVDTLDKSMKGNLITNPTGALSQQAANAWTWAWGS